MAAFEIIQLQRQEAQDFKTDIKAKNTANWPRALLVLVFKVYA